jgi:hypothetical protein
MVRRLIGRPPTFPDVPTLYPMPPTVMLEPESVNTVLALQETRYVAKLL